jgi:tRNA-specific adenosine deaminase 3
MPASMLAHLRAFFAPASSPPSASPTQQQQQSTGQRTWSFRPYLVGLSGLENFLQHATLRLQHLLHRLYNTAAMALRRDSAIANDAVADPQHHMVHLKTKEECRLGNETIQVWTVELPSKYAEGILRYSSPTTPFNVAGPFRMC